MVCITRPWYDFLYGIAVKQLVDGGTMKTATLPIILLTIILSINTYAAGKTLKGSGDKQFQVPVAADEIKIMSYNVLNLFDAEHDRTKLDHTFLPLDYPGKAINCQKLRSDYYRQQCLTLNWTDRKVDLKIKQIKKVISLQGSLPDLLAVEEIENKKVTSRLAQALGYKKFVITNGPDNRGIEVALLYNEDKLDYIEHAEISVHEAKNIRTRNILRVHFRPINGDANSIIAIYVNHWPSQAAPAFLRKDVATVLEAEIDKQTKLHGATNYYIIATGDFNVLDPELPNAFHHVISNPLWDNHLLDVHHLSAKARNPMKHKMPPGTYWFKRNGTYNRFDRFFISRNLWNREGIQIVAKSYRILGAMLNSSLYTYKNRSDKFYATAQYVPLTYDFHNTKVSELGFSDHYPIVVKVRIPKN